MDLDRLDIPATSPDGPAGPDPASDGADAAGSTTPTPTPQRPARRRSRRSLLVLGAAALVALTVGTSVALASSPPATGTPPAATTPPAPAAVDAAFKQYAACMRDHGVDLPDPVSIGASATGPAVDATGPVTLGSPDAISGGAGLHVVVGTATAVQPGAAGTAPAQPAVSSDVFVAADKACSPILEAAGVKTMTSVATGDVTGSGPTLVTGGSIGAGTAGVVMAGSGDVTAMAAGMKAYAACMRTHGVDMPDPVVDAKAGTVQMASNADPSTAAFRAANAACSTGSLGFPAPPAPAATTAP